MCLLLLKQFCIFQKCCDNFGFEKKDAKVVIGKKNSYHSWRPASSRPCKLLSPTSSRGTTIGEVLWTQGWDEENAYEKYAQKFWNPDQKKTLPWKTPSSQLLQLNLYQWGHGKFRGISPGPKASKFMALTFWLEKIWSHGCWDSWIQPWWVVGFWCFFKAEWKMWVWKSHNFSWFLWGKTSWFVFFLGKKCVQAVGWRVKMCATQSLMEVKGDWKVREWKPVMTPEHLNLLNNIIVEQLLAWPWLVI